MVINRDEYNRIIGFKEKLLFQTQAIIARAKIEGFTLPSDKVIFSINQHITDLLRKGIWDKTDAYFQFAYNNIDLVNFSRINWVNPFGVLASVLGTPLYTVDGWEGNGIDGYINTNISPTQTDYFKQDNACFAVTVYRVTNGGSIVGDTNARQSLVNSSSTTQRINSGANNVNAGIDLSGTGLKALIRTTSNDVIGYNQGVITPRTSASATILNNTIWLFRRAASYSPTTASNLLVSSSLSESELNSVRSSYNIYLNSIGLVGIGGTPDILPKSYTPKEMLSQTQAIITRAKNEGFTLPSESIIYAMNEHIKDMVNNGVWDINDSYYQFAYNNPNLLNFSRINWKQPFNSLISIQGSPIYTTNGWEGNAMDGYINTNHVISNDFNYSINSSLIGGIVYKAQIGGSTTGRMCCAIQTDKMTLINSSTVRHRIHTAFNVATTIDMTGTGWKSISKKEALNRELVNKDLNILSSTTNDTSDTNTFTLGLLASPANGSYSNLGLSNFMIGGYLSYTQIQLIRNSYNKYLTNINLNPIA